MKKLIVMSFIKIFCLFSGAIMLGTDADSESSDDSWSDLHCAARIGDLDFLKDLLSDGFNPLVTDSHGATPLHYAAGKGHLEIMKHLLSLPGVDPNTIDKDNCSVLYWAVQNNKLPVVEYLLTNCEVNLLLKDNEGYDVLTLANECCHKEVAYLIEASRRWSPLRAAWVGALVRA